MSVHIAALFGRPRALRRLSRLGWAPTAAAVVLGVMVLMALLAGLLAPDDPNVVDILNPYADPSGAHPLGTDASGRDLLSRLIVGARSAILGPVIVVGIATPVGIAIALLAAWKGGWTDIALSRSMDIVLAFPGLLLAILAAAVWGPSLTVAAAALSVAYVPYVARVVRSEALVQRNRPYVEALWAQGHSAWSIWIRHLIPNLAPLIVAQTTIMLAYATVDVAAISFIGLAVQAPTADWGSMVATGQTGVLEGYPQESLMAGACLFVLVLCISVLGEALSDRAEQRG